MTACAFSSIAIDSTSRTHIAAVEWDGDLVYLYEDSNGNWQEEEIVSNVGGDPHDDNRNVNMVLDDDDNAHISYFDNSGSKIKYATNKSGSWVTETVSNASESLHEHNDISISKLDQEDPIIYITYATANGLKWAFRRCDTWWTETVDTSDTGVYNSLVTDLYWSDSSTYFLTRTCATCATSTVSGSPSATTSVTETATKTGTGTPSPSATATRTGTGTPSPTITAVADPYSDTETESPTMSPTSTGTVTDTATSTPTETDCSPNDVCDYSVEGSLDWDGTEDIDVYIRTYDGCDDTDQVAYYGNQSIQGDTLAGGQWTLSINHDAHPGCAGSPDSPETISTAAGCTPVSYTHLRANETLR